MQISRRAFVKYASVSAAAVGLSSMQLRRAEQAIAAASTPPVVWLSGSGCTGCSISLLNAVNPTIDEVLTSSISLRYHPNLMAAAGELAVTSALSTAQAGGHILVVEGAIPTGASAGYCYVWDEGGRSVTLADAVTQMAATASQIIAVGTCAAYGGIPGAYAPAQVRGLSSYLGRPVIAIPGCPAHPSWVVGAIVQLLAGTPPTLDSYGRPTDYFRRSVHDQCPRRGTEEAKVFGVSGHCMKELGCKGPETKGDCPVRLWNGGQSWCVAVNGLCIGCTEPTFPKFPLHKALAVDRSTPTPTPIRTATATPRATRTPTATSTPTATATPSPTATQTPRGGNPERTPRPTKTPRSRIAVPVIAGDVAPGVDSDY